MLVRAVKIDGVIYRRHEVIQIRHTNGGETFVRVHSTAGAANVNTEHQIAYDTTLGFEKAEESIAELPFFAEVEDPYAAIVEEQAALIDEIADILTDEQAADVPAAFRAWTVGTAYEVGQRVSYDGKVYKCLQAHTAQADWTPDVAASLWADVAPPDVIPVWVQPDSTNPYMAGDKVHYPDADGPIYESLIDNNVYSPSDYPAGWQEVSNEE